MTTTVPTQIFHCPLEGQQAFGDKTSPLKINTNNLFVLNFLESLEYKDLIFNIIVIQLQK